MDRRHASLRLQPHQEPCTQLGRFHAWSTFGAYIRPVFLALDAGPLHTHGVYFMGLLLTENHNSFFTGT